jgi:hypothetical protein
MKREGIHQTRSIGEPLFLLAVLALGAFGCERTTGVTDVAPSVRFISARSLGGFEALAASIAMFRAIANDPVASTQRFSIPGNLNATADDVVKYFVDLQNNMSSPKGLGGANTILTPPKTAAFNDACSGTCMVQGSSYIHSDGQPTNARNVTFDAYTTCSGYPSMTDSGGTMNSRLAYGGGTNFSNTYTYTQPWEPYAYGDVYVSVSGAWESASISTKHTCRTNGTINPDVSYSSSAAQV